MKRFLQFILAIVLSSTAGLSQTSLDTSYLPNVPYSVYALGLQADGKLVTGEGRVYSSPATDYFRFNVNGTQDPTFAFIGDTRNTTNGDMTDVISASCFMDGTVALSGAFYYVNTYYFPQAFKSDEAGKLLGYYIPEVDSYVIPNTGGLKWIVYPHIVALPDNGALIYSSFATIDGAARPGIAKLNSVGKLVSSFLPVPSTTSISSTALIDHKVNCAVVQPDGLTLIAGEFDRFNGQTKPYLVRVTATGALDPNFNPAPSAECNTIALQPDGKIIVTGSFSSIGGGAQSKIARLNSDGTLDNTFSCSIDTGSIFSTALRSDGKLVVAGSFTSVNSSARGRYALLNSDGSLNAAFSTLGTDGSVYGATIQERWQSHSRRLLPDGGWHCPQLPRPSDP